MKLGSKSTRLFKMYLLGTALALTFSVATPPEAHAAGRIRRCAAWVIDQGVYGAKKVYKCVRETVVGVDEVDVPKVDDGLGIGGGSITTGPGTPNPPNYGGSEIVPDGPIDVTTGGVVPRGKPKVSPDDEEELLEDLEEELLDEEELLEDLGEELLDEGEEILVLD